MMKEVDGMLDKVMVGVITQTLKEVKGMTVQELKDHLSNKKLDLPNDKCELNVYWTQTASAVRFKLLTRPDSSRFSYKIGTWNTRMAAAFISSYLMVAWQCLILCCQFDSIYFFSTSSKLHLKHCFEESK